MIKAKKTLGQNFLRDKNILKKIVDIAELQSFDWVLEIGPGLGDLTAKILEKANKIFAVEKDADLVFQLQEKFRPEIDLEKLILIKEDILNFESEQVFTDYNYKIIANIPYYLTGEIFRKIFEEWPKPKKVVLLVQKEVADRIIATDKKESVLSISIKRFGEPKREFVVKAGAFLPAPKVDSAVISISNIKKTTNNKKFFEILKLGFAHKRKTLFNNLKEKINPEKLNKIFNICNLNLKVRPENLTISDWECLDKNF